MDTGLLLTGICASIVNPGPQLRPEDIVRAVWLRNNYVGEGGYPLDNLLSSDEISLFVTAHDIVRGMLRLQPEKERYFNLPFIPMRLQPKEKRYAELPLVPVRLHRGDLTDSLGTKLGPVMGDDTKGWVADPSNKTSTIPYEVAEKLWQPQIRFPSMFLLTPQGNISNESGFRLNVRSWKPIPAVGARIRCTHCGHEPQ